MKMMIYTFFFLVVSCVQSSFLDFERDFGGIANDVHACERNTQLLSKVLQTQANNTSIRLVAENQTMYLYNGVVGHGLLNSHFVIDGTLRFERRPTFRKVYRPPPCFMISDSKNITFTSSTGQGLFDGNGAAYWGIPYIGYAQLTEHRPRLLKINTTSDLVIENMIFKDSPYHTVYLEAVENVVVRHVSIVARRTHSDGHNWIDLSAFNTDGIDVSGRNVHVHDVDIWVQDDCIAVKDNYFEPHVSENMLFERIHCSGFGLVLGSIGGTHVRNITFRDSYLHKSVKGIYLKFRKQESLWDNLNMTGSISDILFQNISMESPLQWPIWIGPAQQADSANPCQPNPCSLCWPQAPFAQCHTVPKTLYSNITLRNVLINNPKMSPGVILGGDDAFVDGMLFDNVRVTTGDPDHRARIPRTKWFPGLLQHIHDPYVPHAVDVVESKEPLLMMGFPKPSDTWFQVMLMITVAVVVTLHVYVWAKRRNKMVNEAALVEEEISLTETERDSAPPQRNGRVSFQTFFRFWNTEVENSLTETEPAPLVQRDGLASFKKMYFWFWNREDENSVTEATEGESAPLTQRYGSASFKKMYFWFWNTEDAVTESSFPRDGYKRIFFWFWVTEVLLILTIVSSQNWITPKWKRVNHYYKCSGVVGGKATKSTWPVPYCFEQIDDAESSTAGIVVSAS